MLSQASSHHSHLAKAMVVAVVDLLLAMGHIMDQIVVVEVDEDTSSPRLVSSSRTPGVIQQDGRVVTDFFWSIEKGKKVHVDLIDEGSGLMR